MQYFYDGQVRRYVTQIVRAFSNFSYKDGDGDLRQVPVTYGDLTRQVASIMRDNSENKIPSAPRMAVYITGLEMDRTRTSDSSFVSKVNLREKQFDEETNSYIAQQAKGYTVDEPTIEIVSARSAKEAEAVAITATIDTISFFIFGFSFFTCN